MKLTRRVLYNKAKPWVFTGRDFQAEQLAQQMLEIMRRERGIGLAAPQIGISKRVFVMEINGKTRTCFNPEIVSLGSRFTDFDEGCLSFPGESYNITRSADIRVRYFDLKGQLIEEDLSDLEARCFQHELDHLDGMTMHERAKERHATES